jgi:hypothetical protein
MTQKDEKSAVDKSFVSSKFGRTLLTILSVFLVFVGPTYGIYALSVVLNVSLAASFVVGFVLLAVGLFLMWYLVKKKIIT